MTPILAVLAYPLANPATPWVVLVLCTLGWLALYLFASSESTGE
ncbi:MAG: hypothetical protein ACRDJE_05340 [Dehalococcoidia bacterium]